MSARGPDDDAAEHAYEDARDAAAASTDTTPADVRAFVTAGRATFTLEGKAARYTYRVNRSQNDDGRPPVYFASLLTGPDNTADYTYIGLLDPSTGALRLTAKSTYTAETLPVRALRWALPILFAGRALPAPARLLHIGRCGRCGRALTVPSSIDAGIGPECATKL